MYVATALNKKYVRYTGVMLLSLATNQLCHVDVYLLHSSLEEEDFSYLASCVSGHDISLHPLRVDPDNFPTGLPHTDQWSMETYYRLLLLDLLPDSVARILYLDSDLIVLKPLDDFYDMSLDGYDLISCVNACGKNNPESYGPKHREMFADAESAGFRYFCAGVTLFNIARMREKYSFDTYLQAFQAWDYQMEAPDQDILNWVHGSYAGYVDPYRYNLFARIAHNDNMTCEDVKQRCSILHFAGDKPWESTNVHYDLEGLWWDYAKETPGYDSLLRDFLESSLRDNVRVENYILALESENKQLQNRLLQASDLLKRISGYQ
ncbi:MAG: hypothetical protein IJP92_10190 [Lachnospiraceae bacterium]|nr:hypothetical protein [Lachnospiraceae bacterium]